MKKIQEIFTEFGDSILQLLPNIISALLVFVLFTFTGIMVKKGMRSRLKNKWQDTLIASFFGDVARWTFIIMGGIIALHLLGFGGVASSIMAGAGISAIIFGFAFKDIAENFLAGILLAIKRPFKMGDIIQTDNVKGPVKSLDLRVTHVRTIDGKDIYIPNAMIVKNVLINYTKDGLIRHEFLVGLDTYDDLSRARRLVLEYFAKQPTVLPDPAPNMVVDEIGTSSVNMKILFWVDIFKPNVYRDDSDTGEWVKSKVIREVLDLLLANGFNLPSIIIEHKMYKENAPLELNVRGKG